MITVKVKLFAMIRDLFCADEMQFSIEEKTSVEKILELLSEKNNRIEEWKPFLRIAVNCEYVTFDCLLRNNDEVAIIPPVSGG
ncbi:MAG: molybdopterin converting factor subunit 1 [Ignavibacteria bacterium]|nr:molybdopterin converting factor subunit 1 [Ignavibacteria bacterium]